MKRKYLLLSTLFIIITISVLTYLSSSDTAYKKIDIYTAKDFNKAVDTPIISINDKKTLKEISTILKKSEQLPGLLDVAYPDYILEALSFNDSMETVYLWIRKDSVNGMLMYKNNTETGYSISKTNTEKLKKIVLTSNN
jgi:hypothetical protein